MIGNILAITQSLKKSIERIIFRGITLTNKKKKCFHNFTFTGGGRGLVCVHTFYTPFPKDFDCTIVIDVQSCHGQKIISMFLFDKMW